MARNIIYTNTGLLDLKTGVFTPWSARAVDTRDAREKFIDSRILLAPPTRAKTRSSRYIEFLRTREYANKFPNGQENVYNINIPGIQDVIRIPNLEDRNLRRQRWERFQRSNPTLPETLQWIPPLINKLDDAQDLLFTGLALAIPLLRILPRFFIGLFAPLVFANDALNLATCFLTLALGGNLGKAEVRSVQTRNMPVRNYLTKRPAQFFKKFPWLSFLLQAPQALQYLTGYGVTLGTVMAFMNEIVWAPIRLLQGARVYFVGPPPDDITGKAARYLSQPAAHNFHNQMFSFEDHALLAAADSIAIQVMAGATTKEMLQSRETTIATTPTVIYDPWNPASLDVAEEKGWNPSDPPGYPIPTTSAVPTYLEAISTINSELIRWTQDIAVGAPKSDLAQLMMLMHGDAGETFMEWVHDDPTDFIPQLSPEEDTIMRLIENGIFPRAALPPSDWILLNRRARQLSAAIGEENPSPDTLRRALNEIFGGSITI